MSRKRRKWMAKGGKKKMWLVWFPKCCNHLCFGERNQTQPSLSVFTSLNCRVEHGPSLALDLSVFTSTYHIIFLFIMHCFYVSLQSIISFYSYCPLHLLCYALFSILIPRVDPTVTYHISNVLRAQTYCSLNVI